MKFKIIILITILSTIIFANSYEELKKGFIDPPIEARPIAYLCLVNGNYNLTQLTYEMEEAKAKGMGGFDIWDVGIMVNTDNVVPAGPEFMSEKSLDAFEYILNEAERLDMNIGLTIASSWNAGGSWIQPEDGVKGFYVSDTIVQGNQYVTGNLPTPKPEKKIMHRKNFLLEKNINIDDYVHNIALIAIKVDDDSTLTKGEIIDISDKLQSNGDFSWNVPSGKWKIQRYLTKPTGQSLIIPSPNSKGLIIDHFSAKATKNNLRFILDKLVKRLGPLDKTRLKYLYTDSYEANSAAWTLMMKEEFKKRRGYEIDKFLPALLGYQIDDDETTKRFLHDFRKTLSDMIIENHYLYSKKISEEYGVGFSAEAAGPGPPLHNCPFEAIKSSGVLSVPRGEFWFNNPKIDELNIIKGVASSSHLYGQKYVEAEAFTSTHIWQYGPGDIKQVADKAMCEGLNKFVYHTFPHSPPEGGFPGWIYNFGTQIHPNRAWWSKSYNFHHYIGRSSYLLQQGNFVADILYYYGDDAPNFVKPKGHGRYKGFGFDYDVCNSDIILNFLDVKNGKLTLPHGQSYSILVLPDDKRINSDVLQKIELLVKKGAILVGERPQTSYGLENQKEDEKLISKLSDKLWKNGKSINKYHKGKVYSGKSVEEVLDDLKIKPDLSVETSPNIDFIHRQIGNEDVYMIRNLKSKAIYEKVTFRIKDKTPQKWNPETGEIRDIVYFNKNKNGITIPLFFESLEAFFVVFTEKVKNNHIVSVKFSDGSKLKSIDCTDLIVRKNGDYKIKNNKGKTSAISVDNIPNAIDLSDSWEVYFDQSRGGPRSKNFDKLISWTDSDVRGIKYYSGVASYRKSFNLNADYMQRDIQITLDMGKVSKVAEVYLNGKKVGISWFAPYKLDITNFVKVGENNLIIEVVNVLSNYMTGDAKLPKEYRRTRSNVQKGPNAWHTPWKDVPLIESGLLGPVKLMFGKRLK